MKLFPYFETTPEFQNKGLEGMLECFPKVIVLKPKEDKLIKLSFQKDSDKVFQKNTEYKSYIIFKELPQNAQEILSEDLLILNEIGIAVSGKK